MHSHSKNGTKGFTLIELIIVVAILAVIAAAVTVAIDPARRLNAADNSKRKTDIQALLHAIKTYQADNDGAFWSSMTTPSSTNYIIGTCLSGAACTSVTVAPACTDFAALETAGYISPIPADPDTGTAENTGYYYQRNPNGLLTIGACEAESEGPGGTGTPETIKTSS